jgi:hypothetical protein
VIMGINSMINDWAFYEKLKKIRVLILVIWNINTIWMVKVGKKNSLCKVIERNFWLKFRLSKIIMIVILE